MEARESSKTPVASSTSSVNRMGTKMIETVNVSKTESSISLSPETSSASHICIGPTSSKYASIVAIFGQFLLSAWPLHIFMTDGYKPQSHPLHNTTSGGTLYAK
ncbi:uncharacterized protein LOC129942319 [Eupeodes corollae]|uniref:uncharacterized protein LOC129942319 n=1 Tax=Eupeodes corollae TaxID=290404 RepID=UPI002493A04E|nr:uncharacterized protein LOC129942319 [Eupeodes corollae]